MKLLLLIATIATLLSSIFPMLLTRLPKISKFSSFSLLGLSGLLFATAGLKILLSGQSLSYQIQTTFPDFTLQLLLDPLAGFFLCLISIIVIAVAFYGPSYTQSYGKKNPVTSLTFFTGLFVLGMYLVVLAHDVFSFMLAWELMSVASYFLVAYHHEHSANRRAALIYLLMAQASGLLILLGFGILTKFTASYSFAAFHNTQIPSFWAAIAFALAFTGFGMKAGIIPLHVWLPEAHPVAPSHISALMSGVMLKVSIYGLIRFIFTLLHQVQISWGIIALAIGVISALGGVLLALMQHDLKKLLAYHSVENIGIIFMGLGLSLIFYATSHPLLAALGLIACLYHCLNHALFKSLLFFGAGAVLQHGHEHDLERMGGLIKKMPYTAWFFLIGCISISALPPFNGFVSEWLTFQAALQTTTLTNAILRILIPVSAALLALTGVLAAACFVKVYGVAFLGQPRTRHVKHARDPRFGMIFAMGILATLCLLFGILPTFALRAFNIISQQLVGSALTNNHNWIWLVPLAKNISSYSALFVLGGILSVLIISFIAIRLFFVRQKIKIVDPWDCGFGGINSRMQYSATAFAMPIRRVFKISWSVAEKIEKSDSRLNYLLQVGDRIWQFVYCPLENLSFSLARLFARLQGGNTRVYLIYILLTLILLLWVIA
jgi:hydrogenase-4 component B